VRADFWDRTLAGRFLEEASKELGKQPPEIPKEAHRLLQAYDFPGNVRELRSMIYEAEGLVDTAVARDRREGRPRQHLPSSFPEPDRVELPSQRVWRLRHAAVRRRGAVPDASGGREYLVAEALRRSNGNQRAAAKLLGVTPQAISKRMMRRKGSRS
jgi:transcriptional regulator with GAF, ATPase, and Fis domain